jgi:hypothetical protein
VLPLAHRITFGFGLFFFGLGVSLLAIGGASVYTLGIVKGDLHGARVLFFPVAAGLSLLAMGSAMITYSLKKDTVVKADKV